MAFHPFYAFPLFILVGWCFQKIRGDGATGLLILPMWPTQSYFGSLLRMLVDQPHYFKTTRTTLTNPLVGELACLLRVTLLVCRVSRNPLSSAAFRHKSCQCVPREMVHVLFVKTKSFHACPCFVNFGYS